MPDMKAVRIDDFGGPEVLKLQELPIPEPQDTEVLIRVRAASVNPVDYKIRSGAYPVVKRENLPIALGRDVAGVVERAGKSVTRLHAGAEIYALLDRGHGGYAQYVALKAELCAHKPSSLSFDAAAGVPLAGLTAWQGLFEHGRLEAGQTVLIHGGAGGVGHLAIQFAKARGARVCTTVSAQDMQFASELGADVAIDYKSERFEDVLQRVDLVFDLIGGETQERSWSVLKRGGTLISTLAKPSEERARELGARATNYMAQPNAAQLGEIGRLIDAGKVSVRIARTFPLEQAAKAQHLLETEHVQGKIVLTV